MSSIMRWRNGLMVLSVMAITPVSHEVSEPHDLETGRAILLIPTSNPPRARSRCGVYRESGLVHGSSPVTYGVATKRATYPRNRDDIDSVESTCRKTKIALNRRETLLGQGILRYSELSDRDANRTNLEGGVS